MNLNNFNKKNLKFIHIFMSRFLVYICFVLPTILILKALYLCFISDTWTILYFLDQFIANIPFIGKIYYPNITQEYFKLSIGNLKNINTLIFNNINELIFVGGLGGCFSWSLFEAFFSEIFTVRMSIGEGNLKTPSIIKLPLTLNKGEGNSPGGKLTGEGSNLTSNTSLETSTESLTNDLPSYYIPGLNKVDLKSFNLGSLWPNIITITTDTKNIESLTIHPYIDKHIIPYNLQSNHQLLNIIAHIKKGYIDISIPEFQRIPQQKVIYNEVVAEYRRRLYLMNYEGNNPQLLLDKRKLELLEWNWQELYEAKAQPNLIYRTNWDKDQNWLYLEQPRSAFKEPSYIKVMSNTTYDNIELEQKKAIFISKYWESAIFKNQFTLKKYECAWNQSQTKLDYKKAIITIKELKNQEITNSFTEEVKKLKLKESLSKARSIRAELEKIKASISNWDKLIRLQAVGQEKQAQLILEFFLENQTKMEAQNKQMADLIIAESKSKLNKIKGELSTWDVIMGQKELVETSKRKREV